MTKIPKKPAAVNSSVENIPSTAVKQMEKTTKQLPNSTDKKRKYFALIKKTIGKDLLDEEVELLLYTAKQYDLDPLVRQISATVRFSKERDPQNGKETGKYTRTLQMIVQRDGYLAIAHRSGVFKGMKTTFVKDDKGILVGAVCEVYRSDWEVPMVSEVDLSEYKSAQNPLWASKPKTMIGKVAESQALRKAFNVTGVYDEVELDQDVPALPTVTQPSLPDKPATEAQIATIRSLKGEPTEDMSFAEAVEMIRHLSEEVK